MSPGVPGGGMGAEQFDRRIIFTSTHQTVPTGAAQLSKREKQGVNPKELVLTRDVHFYQH